MARVWADWNSYAEPTIGYERTDHLPYYPPRIDYFRWMYGKGPGETPANVLYGPVETASYENTELQPLPQSNSLNEPAPIIPPAPAMNEMLPPIPSPEANQKQNDYELIGFSTDQKKKHNRKKSYTPIPRKSWMFSNR